jgi:hypothetical protein
MAPVKHHGPTKLEVASALTRGKAEVATGASAVRYDRKRDAIVLNMRSGAIATIPRSLIPIVGDAEQRAAADPELSPMGTSLRFPFVDADFAVVGLIRKVFDVNEANRIAGSTKTAARAAASRRNGRKGGRPRTKTVA